MRPPRTPERRRRARDGRGRHASRCCCPAPSTSCARRKLPPVAALRAAGVPIAIATDHNPGSSPTLSLLLMLNMACTLFRLTPEEALRGVDRATRARALGLRRPRHARSRPARRLRGVGRSSIRTSWPTGFGRNPCRRVVAGGDEERDDERLTPSFTLQRGTRRCWSACRTCGTRIPDELQRRYVDARARGRRHRLAPRPRSTRFARELGASLLVPRHSRYVIDLNRPPENTPMYPGANNTELCPTRFFTGDPLYRDGRAPDDGRDRAPARALLAAVPRRARRRARAPEGRARPCVLFDGAQHQVASCRGCSKAGCPTSTSAPPAARAARRRCAPRSPTCWRRSDASRHVVDGRFKGGYITRHYGRPDDGVHAVQLEMCWRCYMDEAPPYAARRRAQPRACSRCCARCSKRCLDWDAR